MFWHLIMAEASVEISDFIQEPYINNLIERIKMFTCHNRNEIISRRKLANIIRDYRNNFGRIILKGEVIRTLNCINTRGAACTTYEAFLIELHENVHRTVVDNNWQIQCPHIPYRYFHLLELTIRDRIEGTLYDIKKVLGDEASTVCGSEDSDAGYTAAQC